MHSIILLCLGLILSVSLLIVLAQKLKIAYPIFLVIAGVLFGLVPQIPRIHIDPDLVFLVLLPPILFEAAQSMSLKSLWKWRRIISVMAIGFVLFTAIAVAFVAHWIIPGFSFAEGFLLGAIISPPDAAAASAVLRYTPLPKSMKSILEGESLLNDATSLTVFKFALAAIITHNFTWSGAVGNFFLVVVSGIAIGLAFGFLFYAIYKWLPTTANLDVAISLVIPFSMYITAEMLNSSGVLAVVSGGLFIAYQNHFVFSHSSRLRAGVIWTSLVFILNAVVFFLIGLQFPDIVRGLKSMPVWEATGVSLIICLVIIVVRLLAGLFSSIFTRFISRYIKVAQNNPGWRNPLIISWVGMRGVVSLASALTIPLLMNDGSEFPYRDLILFITFAAILVTLVVQGLAIPWVVKLVKPDVFEGIKPDVQQILEIEKEMIVKGLQEMERLLPRPMESNQLLKNKYEFLENKVDLLQKSSEGDGQQKEATSIIHQFKHIMMEVTEAERKELHKFRKVEGYDDDVIRLIENRLDLEQENMNKDIN
jgi:Na+/H+ antiporter